MSADQSLSNAQFGGGGNGMPSQYGNGMTPEPIRAQPHQHADFDSPDVVALQARNMSTYGRTTAWRSRTGSVPNPHSRQTMGSYLNFDS